MSEVSMRALLLAEAVMRDATGRAHVMGIFSKQFSTSVPAPFRAMMYLRMADVVRGGVLRAVVTAPGPDGTAVWATPSGRFPAAVDPTEDVEVMFAVAFEAPRYGTYWAEVYVDNERIGGTKFEVKPWDGQTPPGDQIPFSSGSG